MSDLISIVIPIYNVEKYLERCLDSVISQTYTDLQIILVNDGSTDRCEEICRAYLEKDARMEYIGQENGGLSAARNAGIAAAKGKYLIFTDSDDYVAKDYVKVLYELLTSNDADIAVCNLKRTDRDELQSQDYGKQEAAPEVTVYNGKELIRNMYPYNGDLMGASWNKIYKTSFFATERFPVGKYYEDFALVTKLLYRAEKVVITNQVLYYYFQASTSITNRPFTKKHLDILEQIEVKLDFFKEQHEFSVYRRCLQEYEVTALKTYYLCKKNIKDSKDEQKQIMRKYKGYLKEAVCAKENLFLRKVYMLCGLICPYLMGKVTTWILKK